MNTKTSTLPAWLIWAITILAISFAFMTYALYAPSKIKSQRITSQNESTINSSPSELSQNEAILETQQQLVSQLIAIQKQNEKNRHDIMLIKETQEQIQQSVMNREIENFSENNVVENKLEDSDAKPQSDEQEQAQQQEYIQSIDNVYSSQDEDSMWTNQVTNDFEIAFENYSDQLVLHDVSCGDSICKLNASVNTDQITNNESVQLDHLINGDAKWAGQSFYEMNTETGAVTVYLMREGEAFPQAN